MKHQTMHPHFGVFSELRQLELLVQLLEQSDPNGDYYHVDYWTKQIRPHVTLIDAICMYCCLVDGTNP